MFVGVTVWRFCVESELALPDPGCNQSHTAADRVGINHQLDLTGKVLSSAEASHSVTVAVSPCK